MSDLAVWLTIVAIGVGTFCLRLSFMALLDAASMPAGLRRALRFVPPAVLAALVAPGLLFDPAASDYRVDLVRLAAGLAGLAAAWRTRSVVWTLVTGMGALWLITVAVG